MMMRVVVRWTRKLFVEDMMFVSSIVVLGCVYAGLQVSLLSVQSSISLVVVFCELSTEVLKYIQSCTQLRTDSFF